MKEKELTQEEKIKIAQEKVEKLKKSILAIGFQIEETGEEELKLEN